MRGGHVLQVCLIPVFQISSTLTEPLCAHRGTATKATAIQGTTWLETTCTDLEAIHALGTSRLPNRGLDKGKLWAEGYAVGPMACCGSLSPCGEHASLAFHHVAVEQGDGGPLIVLEWPLPAKKWPASWRSVPGSLCEEVSPAGWMYCSRGCDAAEEKAALRQYSQGLEVDSGPGALGLG